MPSPPFPSVRALLLGVGLAGLSLAPGAAAQTGEASGRAVYVLARGAVAGVEGDLGTTFEDPGVGLGVEAGVRLGRHWAVGVGWWAQSLPSLREGYPFRRRPNGQGSRAYQGQALARFHVPVTWAVLGRPVSPFVEAGLAFVSGQGTEDERNRPDSRAAVWGYGPLGGLGYDVVLTPRLALRAVVQSTVVVPDAALDGADPSAFADEPSPPAGARSDAVGYDVLTNASLGVRYAFASRPRSRGARVPEPPTFPDPPTPPVSPEAAPSPPVARATPPAAPPAPRISRLSCPPELAPGEEGVFAVETETPGDVVWSWGDGSASAAGEHAYDAPGTYVVAVTATSDGGEASETCRVTVLAAPEPPSLAACRVTPATAAVGKAVVVEADVVGAEAVTVDFGDGASATALPARHDYDRAGTFTVAITALNDAGRAGCTAEVTVGDPVCDAPALPGPLRFKSGDAGLTTGAMAILDTAVGLFERCPAVCLTLRGHATPDEGDAAEALAQQRADAAMFYLIGQGVDADRLRAVGRGTAAVSEAAGTDRRVEATAGACADF